MPRLILEKDVGELLSAVVAHDETMRIAPRQSRVVESGEPHLGF
jgi:hypothetical protein